MFIKDLNAMAQEIESLEINWDNLTAQRDTLNNEIIHKMRIFNKSISEYLHYTLYKCIRDCGFINATGKYNDYDVYEDPKKSSPTIWLTKPTADWNDWDNNSSTYRRVRNNDDDDYYIDARHVIYIVYRNDQNKIAYKAVIMAFAQYDGKTDNITFACGSTSADMKNYIFNPKITKRCDTKDMYLVSFASPFIGESEFVNEVKKIISEKGV